MGFFNRFRKKEERTGAPAEPEVRAAVSEWPETVTGGEKQSDAARTSAAQANQPAEGFPSERDGAAPSMRGVAAQPKEISPEEVKSRMDAGTALQLIDVREPWEHQIANIAPATLIPMNSIPARMDELDRNAEIVVYCHHGTRSWNVASYLAQHGFANVKNLTGGIDSWARRIDRSMRTY
jgi:rhodanese-related sulfurtransferase